MTKMDEWRHCPSKDNPSDVCSHGLHANPSNNKKWALFTGGPAWLAGSKETWPEVRPSGQKKAGPATPVANIAAINVDAVDAKEGKINWILSLTGK